MRNHCISWKGVLSVLLLTLIVLPAIAQPVQGDDLIKLLGKRNSVSDIQSLERYIGNDFATRGIKLDITRNVLQTIDLYNNENPYLPEMQQFKGKLPKGLKFGSSIFDAKKSLGEGYKTEGEVTASLVLIKEFPLNAVDGYEISLDFQKGRLTIVTLKFVEGGAANQEEASSAATIGISNSDYFEMVKKNAYNLKYVTLKNAIGASYDADRTKQIFLKQGLAVYFNNKSMIEKMVFYSGGQPYEDRSGMKFGGFPVILPLGIKFTDTETIVRQKCGTPAGNENGALVYTQGIGKLLVYFSGGKVGRLEMVYNEAVFEEKKAARKAALEAEKAKKEKIRKAQEAILEAD